VIGSEVIVDHVSKSFDTFCALGDVSLKIRQGEFFSLLGPSGCGKTTLLRIIAGFESPDSGNILLDNENVVALSPDKRRCNTVFQSYALFPHLSIYENVAFPLRLKKVKESVIDEKVQYYLNLVQLNSQMSKMPNQISGGQKQRVAIARALINEPKVLLLDEPLSALDAKLRTNLLRELDRIHDQIGITFIYVTHDQTEALSVSDRIAVMNHGKILQVGEPYEIYESPSTGFVANFIGETNSFTAVVEECEKLNETNYLCTLMSKQLGKIQITDYEETKPGQKVSISVRPEKINISLDEKNQFPGTNIFSGIVEEPVYAGFQSKLFVRLDNGTLIKIYQQHKKYLEDGPEINYQDRVYISWTAEDGYIIEDIEN